MEPAFGVDGLGGGRRVLEITLHHLPGEGGGGRDVVNVLSGSLNKDIRAQTADFKVFVLILTHK